MAIRYSDGVAIEAQILDALQQEKDLRSIQMPGASRYGEWAFHYHLCPERANLLRHLDFSGLDVLELGAGMGGVSRFLAESAKTLTVVEGTEARFLALKERLRDLTNWTGSVGRAQDATFDRKFDVVCVIGVLEYSELYVTPPEGSGETPFTWFLKQAARHLREGGVLILAIENQLGIKYWSGAAEDHTARLFDGICGYPSRPTPRTFSREELLSIVRKSGFESVDEYFPFPDYKIPKTVLSRELFTKAPDLASDLATIEKFETYGPDRIRYFPDLLAYRTVSQAGLGPEFSNSFLFIAARDPGSRVLRQLNRRKIEGAERAWHYSLRRELPVVTTFVQNGDSFTVRKIPLQAGSIARSPERKETRDFIWQSSFETGVHSGLALRVAFSRECYFQNWDALIDRLTKFIRWSFQKWEMGDSLRGESLDAIWLNALVGAGGDFQLYDQEWTARKPIPRSWFVFRNVFAFIRDFESFDESAPFVGLKGLYEKLCEDVGVTPDFAADLEREAAFQHQANPALALPHHLQSLERLFGEAFGQRLFPRQPAAERLLRQRASHQLEENTKLRVHAENLEKTVQVLQSACAELQGTVKMLNETIHAERRQAQLSIAGWSAEVAHLKCRITSLEGTLGSPLHRVAARVNAGLKKVPGLRSLILMFRGR